MSGRIDKKELARRVSERIDLEEEFALEVVDAVFEEMYNAFKAREPVSIRNFGSFYIEQRRDSCAFRFNPSQRLRRCLGWSSTYKGGP